MAAVCDVSGLVCLTTGAVSIAERVSEVDKGTKISSRASLIMLCFDDAASFHGTRYCEYFRPHIVDSTWTKKKKRNIFRACLARNGFDTVLSLVFGAKELVSKRQN
jgi:hypothetical protein